VERFKVDSRWGEDQGGHRGCSSGWALPYRGGGTSSSGSTIRRLLHDEKMTKSQATNKKTLGRLKMKSRDQVIEGSPVLTKASSSFFSFILYNKIQSGCIYRTLYPFNQLGL
jgi:hypothetical protein